jgi:hypothetical protein
VSLTGRPVLVLAIVGTLAAVVLLVFLWRRPGLRWLPVRALGIVLCEALALLSVGLVANKQLDLYPSWTALLGRVHAKGQVVDPTSALSRWLRGRQAQGAKDGIVFNWQPASTAHWQLASQPIAYVPPAYFRDPNTLLPVIVAIAPAGANAAHAAWTDKGVARLLQAPPPGQRNAIIVLIRTDRAVPGSPASAASRPSDVAAAVWLCNALPAQLEHDLRVTRHGWALIGVGSAASAALAVFAGDPGPFTAVAVVADGTTALPAAVVNQVRALPVGTATLVIVDRRKQKPAAPASGSAAAAKPPARFGAALDWAYTVLPPPLGPPAVLGPVIIPTAPVIIPKASATPGGAGPWVRTPKMP